MKPGNRFLMGSLLVAALVLGLAAPLGQVSLAAGVTIYVDADAAGAENGTSWTDAFTDLQDALDIAANGDQIWVAEGTYKPTTPEGRSATFQLESGVALYGGFDPLVGDIGWEERDWETNLTSLSGDIGIAGNYYDNCYHVVSGDEVDVSAVLDGFTIADGYADELYDPVNNKGGGMYNIGGSPTLAHLTFFYNFAIFSGGGMYNENGSPTLTDVTFDSNRGQYSGGGMYNENGSPTLTDVIFSANSMEYTGGGMYNSWSSPTLTHVIFSGNISHGAGGMMNDYSSPTLTDVTFSGNSAYLGGGMINDYSSPTLVDVTFSGNSAFDCGGMSNVDSNSTLTDVTFLGNKAYRNGAGMCSQSDEPEIHARLTNVTFSGNTAVTYGGGMYIELSSPILTNVTFSNNSAGEAGGGMYNLTRSYPTLTNAILWGSTPEQIFNVLSTPVIFYSDIQGGCPAGATCDHVINLDPQFMRSPSPGADGTWTTPDDDYGDLRLHFTSPAVDAGDNTAVPAGITADLLGFPRFVDVPFAPDTGFGTPPIIDMGAYEAQVVVVYLTILMK